ncbi:hypothetical protein [Mesorhizobium sp. B2-1-3A]|uniref:hypothetical protein n=1 Tax=Mesorhizobium sp. B2-1-3A TaxID=2589971 RepID=UPI00112932EA|nr:hypothetical protein [Mesorhizobium sp. B2-1-3A]TPM93656.1 hypothetical protein FJ977_25925 [Mesorhizobium sp. B2-1-3A]
MISAIRNLFDAWRGAGAYSVTVPPMDGALSPNQVIEGSPLALEAKSPDNLISDGSSILFSSGNEVRSLRGSSSESVATFDSPVTALAARPGGGFAVGLDDGRVLLKGGRHDGRTLSKVGGHDIRCPTALSFVDEGTLVLAVGSASNQPSRWKRDFMQKNASGSVWRVPVDGEAECLADGLAFPYGLLAQADGSVIVSESWRNQLIRVAKGQRPVVELGDIAGYPARLSPAAGGGAWLAVFAPRSQLIEFVLREEDYRQSMMTEVPEHLWIAPSISAPLTFLEPLQGGGLKHLGIVKPWAPTRSYGLVLRLDEAFQPIFSMHSRADGRRHGITSCLEADGRLLATSKGGDAIVSLPTDEGFGE